MTFEEKVKFLRSSPRFKVVPISEVRAIAFAAKEKTEPDEGDFILTRTPLKTLIILTPDDIKKILRVYPDLAPKLKE